MKNKIVDVIIAQGKLAVSVITNKYLDVSFNDAGCQCQFMAIITKGTTKKIANVAIVFFITNPIYKLN
ncbi:hypothetical protein [Gilliamella sp. App6-5]|uniref:hypothetical protein n=1 Tax=Gilliamella sp. App6-5 TaxID=3120232 RepID=UPI0020FFF9F1|nr:hypothetical protein [Gilliamella apicola]